MRLALPVALAIVTLSLAGVAVLLRNTSARERRLQSAFDHTLLELEGLQQAFHQFAPQAVVEDIIQRGVSIHGERREVTVLFADIVGFTTISERIEPDAIVRMLNGYFRAMTRAISDHNGRVGKFIGDGIMAMFGVPDPNPWQAMDAVQAALAMREALPVYNRELEADGLAPITIGVGIHRGTVVAGVLGSQELMEYTVIGDVVNAASRIEHFTRDFGVDIIISDAVAQALDKRFRLDPLQPVEIRGKQEKVPLFAVVGRAGDVTT